MCEDTSELDLQVLPATDVQGAIRVQVAYIACPAISNPFLQTTFLVCMHNCCPSYNTFHTTLQKTPQTQTLYKTLVYPD